MNADMNADMNNGRTKIVERKFGPGLAAGVLLAISALAAAAFGQATPPILSEPTKVPAAYQKAYIPIGFDSNDSVEVVLEGRFSSSCWRPAEISFAVDQDKQEIHVGPAAYLYPARLCAQLILPFDRVINFGVLKAGNYKLIQATDGALLGEVPVQPATSDRPDDFLYAPVSQAFYKKKVDGGEVTMAGNFPNSCMLMDEVKVQVQPDVVVLQPIAKIEKRLGCQDGSFPFQVKTKIPQVTPGRYLLHVRSMNAKSINSLVEM
jgi:hypothetical protein